MAGNLLWSSSKTHDDDDDDDDRKSSIERDHITRFARNKMADTMLNCLTCCNSAFAERFGIKVNFSL